MNIGRTLLTSKYRGPSGKHTLSPSHEKNTRGLHPMRTPQSSLLHHDNTCILHREPTITKRVMLKTQLPAVRPATPADADVVLALVDALADYEKLQRPDAEAKKRLIRDMFGERRRIEAYLGEYDGKPVGYAFVFETYSSFLALPTLYLEDLFVLPEYRSRKVGYALFRAMVAEAYHRGCGRMEWMVLDWNRLAIDFYNRLGATHMKEWQLYRLLRADMENLLSRTTSHS
jgi:GNAT superfamily N-acetyltransferase